MRAVLGNVEELKRDYPGFQVPPVEHREDLRPGDLAELMLLTDQYPQSIWAEIDEVPGPGWYRGVLETGEPIEFGPEHVSDIKVPSPQMGAERPSVFDYFHPGREPKPGARPSIWNWEEHAAWVDAERARKAAEAAGRPKRSFWDWLRRKPTTELTPIPEPERRMPPRPRGMLPGPVEVFEEAPKPTERPRREPPSPPPPGPTIIVPAAPPPAVGPMEVPETIIEHGAPVSFFDVLGPGPAEPPAAAPPSGGLIIAPELPPAPPVPGGMVVAPQQPVADVFNVLGPAAPAPGAGLIVPEVRTTLPAAANVFDVLAPEAPRGMVRHEVTPFDVLAPEPPSGAMVQQEVTPFDVIAAPPAGPVTPFDVLAPEPSSGLVVHEPTSVFDVLAPQAEQGLAPYVEPGAPSPFDIFQPPPGPAVVEPPVEEEAPKKKRKKKKVSRFAEMDWLAWVRDNFDLEELRDGIKRQVEDEWHQERVVDEEYSGIQATIGVLTWENWNWHSMARELGIDMRDLEPYLEKMDEEAEQVGAYDEEWEKFQNEVIEPISEALNKAFKQLVPELKGDFFLGDDGATEGQTYGIVYYEGVSEAERKRLRRELEHKKEQERKESVARAQKIEDEKKQRKQELRRIWGRMPTVDEVTPWVEQVYGSEFWRNLKKNRNSKGFQAELENAYGQGESGVMEVEAIADEGPHLYEQLSSYFGIPPDIFQVYLGGIRPEEEEHAESLLWNEVLRPYFEVVGEALNRERPKGLPGEFAYEWDDDDRQFFLKYIEFWEE